MAHQDPQSRNETILQNILGEMHDLLPAQSRVEAILQAILNETSYEPAPQSRIEELLLAIKDGGTFDDEARSRNEAILLAKLNGEEYTAEPQSRIEELLIEWANVPSWILKTVSGSVVSVDDAIAAPAEALTVEVVAWQEGSGDPSPDNVRPIHGFSVLNATRAGLNLANIAQETEKRKNGEFLFTLVYEGSKVTIETSTTASLYVVWGLFQIPKSFVGVTVTLSNSGDGILYLCRMPNADYSGTITDLTSRSVKTYTFSDSDVGSYLGIRFINATGSDKYIENVQLEVGSTATDYEPYVTPTIYTIQLGQEVYGAEVDVVNGVAHVTHKKDKISSLRNILYDTNNQSFYGYKDDIFVYSGTGLDVDVKCEIYKTQKTTPWVYWSNVPTNSIGVRATSTYVVIKDTRFTNVADLISGVGDEVFTYPLAEPFDIQLTPTQIELLKDNNTLYADTGGITLTYKAHE